MSPARLNALRRLSEIAMAALDASAVDRICDSLEAGLLEQHSTAAIHSTVAHGNPSLEGQVRELQHLWRDEFSMCSGPTLALILRACAAGIQLNRAISAKTQVVWTGPRVDGSYLRATREVAREIVREAQAALLVVGYWLASSREDGIIHNLLGLLAEAVQRGVNVVLILDERRRTTGADNRQILVDAWPRDVPLPRLLTWRIPPHDRDLKLHAKVLVADARDGLVTSANLTGYAMDRNIEMGVRIGGEPCAQIVKHFDLLIARGVLELFEARA